ELMRKARRLYPGRAWTSLQGHGTQERKNRLGGLFAGGTFSILRKKHNDSTQKVNALAPLGPCAPTPTGSSESRCKHGSSAVAIPPDGYRLWYSGNGRCSVCGLPRIWDRPLGGL